MAGANYVLDKGFEAGGAIGKYRCVELGASEAVTQCNALNDSVIGVCQETITADDATNGRVADVRLAGISRCIAGAALATPGVRVRADATGKVVAVDATAGVVNNVVGILLQTAAADGDHVDVFLTPGVTVNSAAS